jgi:hypothetical protein
MLALVELCLIWIKCLRGVDFAIATQHPCSSGSEITDAGAEAIARALEKNTTLQSLDLGGEVFVFCYEVFGLWG